MSRFGGLPGNDGERIDGLDRAGGRGATGVGGQALWAGVEGPDDPAAAVHGVGQEVWRVVTAVEKPLTKPRKIARCRIPPDHCRFSSKPPYM